MIPPGKCNTEKFYYNKECFPLVVHQQDKLNYWDKNLKCSGNQVLL